MKFETIIIGGGLAGITSAIRLAEQGKKVGLITTGRSALHLHSGSFGLLGFGQNHEVAPDVASALETLPENHPYRKIGLNRITPLAGEAADMLRRAGVSTDGTAAANHTRISPLGILRPAWLTIAPLATLEKLRALPGRRIAIVGLAGFLDFYPRFISASLQNEGFECELLTVDTPDLKNLRCSESEMRAANIARILTGEAVDRLAAAVNDALSSSQADAVLIPAIADFDKECLRLRRLIDRPTFYVPTMGVSVAGIAIYARLMHHFVSLGGRLFNGHKVIDAQFAEDRLVAVNTDLLGEDALYADNFVLASGSFFSRGLIASPNKVTEPALGLDTVSPAADSRYAADLFEPQPLFGAGVVTDSDFRALREGNVITNLYIAGAILPGADAVNEDSGSGIAMLTALTVADKILNA